MFAVADVSEAEVSRCSTIRRQGRASAPAIGFDPRPQIEGDDDKRARPENAESVLARIIPPEDACQIDVLEWLDAREIADMIEEEHPQIAAVVLAHLDPVSRGQCSNCCPTPAARILHRVATLGPVTPEAIEKLRMMLAGRAGAATKSAGVPLGGTREAAKILSGARKSTEQRVMPKLSKIDREVARAIEEEMFVFDNLLELDDKNLGTLLRSVDGEMLAVALKGVDEAIRGRFLGCMSAAPPTASGTRWKRGADEASPKCWRRRRK